MAKLTYSEQLRHPNWQRRRLEMLNAADFHCTECGSGEKTLNVHHKRYVKGRMAWEYSDDELVVLCEDCHVAQHALDDLIGQELVKLDDYEKRYLVGFLIGRRHAHMRQHDPSQEGKDVLTTPPYNFAYVMAQITCELGMFDGTTVMRLWAELKREPETLKAHVKESIDAWEAAHTGRLN